MVLLLVEYFLCNPTEYVWFCVTPVSLFAVLIVVTVLPFVQSTVYGGHG